MLYNLFNTFFHLKAKARDIPDAWQVRLDVPLTLYPTGHWNTAVCPSLVPSTLIVSKGLEVDIGSQ